MSFDFFNEGFKKDAAPIFSAQQNAFLQSRLPFLDPKRTLTIPIGKALELLKYSGLRSDKIQKILKNCNMESGKKTLNYEEMKKVLRGVALSQNDIQPSQININANIKTKNPIFYDGDSEEEQTPVQPPSQPFHNPPEQPKPTQDKARDKPSQQKIQKPISNAYLPPQPQPQPQNQSQPLKKTQIAQNLSFAQFPSPQNNHITQRIQPPQLPPQQPPQQSPQPHQQSHRDLREINMGSKIREFEIKWDKLKTEGKTDGSKIDGGDVKNLCKKLSQRGNLSKAWKLCCHTHSGSLTKGEFYIFLQLITSNKIPEALSSQMKAIISQIDNKHSHPESNQKSFYQLPSHQQPNNFSQLASSQLFDNFAKPETFVVRDRDHSQPAIIPEKVIDKTDERIQRVRGKMEQARRLQNGDQHARELLDLRRGQEVMNNLMGEVEQFLGVVNAKNEGWKGQIQELKQGQQVLNQRLNKVCVAMNGVIMKQHAIIEELVSEISAQNSINQQRVNLLQNHIANIQQQLEVKENQVNQLKEQQSSSAPKRTQPVEEIPKRLSSQPSQSLPSSPEAPPKLAQDQAQGDPNDHVQEPERKSIQIDSQYEHRMKIKRGQVLQLIMYVSQPSQEDMPALNQYINQYNEEQLNLVYTNFYQKLQARQQAQQQLQQQQQMRQSRTEQPAEHSEPAAQPRTQPPQDQFSTVNFEGSPPPAQDMFE